MIKAVAQAIPAYCMSTFLVPISLAEELERMLNSFWWVNKGGGEEGIRWKKWDKLCTRKEDGGLGFRNFRLFNLTMLGKIGWCLVTHRDALVCRVLKDKYLPPRDFLNAVVGHSPSFTWRSICSSEELLQSGLRWRTGSGHAVRVFQDPWIRRDGGFFARSYHDNSLHDMRVSEFLRDGMRCWDEGLVQLLFDAEEAKEILRTPLNSTGGDDSLIWHYSTKGCYTVKSCYKHARAMILDPNYTVEGSWKNIWTLSVPHKVKVFLWRATHDVLPTKANLLSRGIAIGGSVGFAR